MAVLHMSNLPQTALVDELLNDRITHFLFFKSVYFSLDRHSDPWNNPSLFFSYFRWLGLLLFTTQAQRLWLLIGVNYVLMTLRLSHHSKGNWILWNVKWDPKQRRSIVTSHYPSAKELTAQLEGDWRRKGILGIYGPVWALHPWKRCGLRERHQPTFPVPYTTLCSLSCPLASFRHSFHVLLHLCGMAPLPSCLCHILLILLISAPSSLLQRGLLWSCQLDWIP